MTTKGWYPAVWYLVVTPVVLFVTVSKWYFAVDNCVLIPESVLIKFPAIFVVVLEGSKNSVKNLAGFVNAKVLITVKGYADDLLHAVSDGAWSPNFHPALLPGMSKLSISPTAIGSNKVPYASTGK